MGGTLGQADLVLAIFRRTAGTTPPAAPQLPRQVAQRRVFAQPSDDRRPGPQGAFQEGRLHVAAIDDDPQRFSGLFDDRAIHSTSRAASTSLVANVQPRHFGILAIVLRRT